MTDGPENSPLYEETTFEPPQGVTPIRPKLKTVRAGDMARDVEHLAFWSDPKHLTGAPPQVAQLLAEIDGLVRQLPVKEQGARPRLSITPYQGRDPATLQRREWVYPGLYVKKFLSVTISPGGLGKTGLAIVEALAMATGRDLLGDGFTGPPRRVWFWNGEDPFDELVRQVEAAKIHYGISDADIGGRLFMDSGRDLEIKLARAAKGDTQLDRAIIAELTEEIVARQIDVAVFDPFVTIHAVPESSNDAIDQVATALAQIANDTNCAIGIVAHTRKLVPGSGMEITADDNRGASALVNKARVARVLNRMTKEEAQKAGIAEGAHQRYFRVGGDGNKQNLTPPSEDKTWRYNASVTLPNGFQDEPGDSVRVCTPWSWPDAFHDVTTVHLNEFVSLLRQPPQGGAGWRSDVQAEHWAGKLLADVLGHDPDSVGRPTDGGKKPEDPHLTAKLKDILKTWKTNGVTQEELRHDPVARKERPFLAPGPQGHTTQTSRRPQTASFGEFDD